MRGEYTATLLGWEDRRFAVEIAGYQLSFALAGAWCGLRRQTEALKGVAFALILAVGITAVGNLLGWGGRLPLVAQLGIWALALGLALLTALAASRTGTGTSAQALTSGYHLAWAVGAVLGGLSIVVAAIALRERRTSAADAPCTGPAAATAAPDDDDACLPLR